MADTALDQAFNQISPDADLNQSFEQIGQNQPVVPPEQQVAAQPQLSPTPSSPQTVNGMVNVVDPDTQEIGSIPAAQLHDAINQGFQPASQDQVQMFLKKQKYETPGQQAITALEGAGVGSTFGLSTAAEKAFGVTDEDIQARREINPGWHTAGEVGGLAASSLIPGLGEANLLEKAGVGAAKFAGLGAEGAGALSRIGASAINQATQMALLQGGDEVSRMISNDPNQTLGTAVADIGLSGLIGAGGGAALGVVSPLWSAGSGKVSQFIDDFKSRLQTHLDNPNPAGLLEKEIGEHYNAVRGMADEVYGAQGLKSQEIEKLLPQEMTPKISNQIQELNNAAEKGLADLADDPLARNLKKATDRFQKTVTNPEASVADVFDATNTFKQELQEYANYSKLPGVAERDFINTTKDLAFKARTALEDPAVWGKAAERQQAINGAFKEFLPTLKDFEKKFTSEIGGVKQIDPQKVQTYYNQLGKTSSKMKQEMLGNFLDASEKYQKVIADTHSNLGIPNPYQPTSTTAMRASMDKLTPGAQVADAFVKKGIAHMAGEGVGATIGGSVGHLFGAGGFGALIGEHMLGPFFSSVLPALAKPILENKGSADGLKAAIDYSLATVRGENMIGRASRNVLKAGAQVLPENRVTVSDKQRTRLDKSLKSLQADSTPLLNVGGSTGHYLPQHAQAIGATAANAVNYLNGLRPATEPQNPLDSKLPPNPVKQAQYNRALDIAQEPLLVMKSIKDGTLQPQDLVHLKNLYPDLYTKLQSQLGQDMVTHLSKGETIPYKTRMGMSMFLGQPLDSTMTPSAIQATQSITPANQNQSQGDQMMSPKKNTAKLGKSVNLEMTPLQAREQEKRQ